MLFMYRGSGKPKIPTEDKVVNEDIAVHICKHCFKEFVGEGYRYKFCSINCQVNSIVDALSS